MLMICSSLARNRSPDLVVACCFGRIVPSDAVKESWFAQKENRKRNCKLPPPQGAKPGDLNPACSPKTDSPSMG
jgi:hypothetical protein